MLRAATSPIHGAVSKRNNSTLSYTDITHNPLELGVRDE